MTRHAPARRRAPAITSAAVLLTGLWLAATLNWPFGWDQGIFAWVGSVIRDGGMPYQDAVDLKGPLVYYVYAAAQAVFGANTWGIRALDALFMITAAIALRSILLRFVPPSAATWAGCGLILWIGSLGFWSTAQPDGWVGLMMTGSTALLFAAGGGGGSRPHESRVILAAVLAGATALVKPFYFALVLLPVAWIWMPVLAGEARPRASVHGSDSARGVDPRYSRRAIVTLFTLGAAAVPLAIAVGWLALHGALNDAIDVHLRFTAESYSGLDTFHLWGRIRGFAQFVVRLPVLLFALPAMAAGVVAAWRADRSATAILAAWTVLAIGFVILQNRFYLYQAVPMFPPLAAFAAIGFYAIVSAAGWPERRSPAGGAAMGHGPAGASGRVPGFLRLFVITHLTLTLLHLAAGPVLDIRRAARFVTGAISADDYYRTFAPMMSYNAADERATAEVLARRSHPDDLVAILGYNAGILYLADRQSPTRFGLSVPFTHPATTPLTRRFQNEYIGAVERLRPRWIVVGAIDGAPWTLEARLNSHPRLRALVELRYCLEEEIGYYVLFALCEAA